MISIETNCVGLQRLPSEASHRTDAQKRKWRGKSGQNAQRGKEDLVEMYMECNYYFTICLLRLPSIRNSLNYFQHF